MVSQAAEQIKTPATRPPKRREIPAYLVRETIDGIPFYYRGYRSVLNKTKTFEEIMADSGLQTLLKNLLADFLKLKLNRQHFYVFNGETGSHINHRNNLGLDVAVFDKSVLTPEKITTKYVDVPPKLVIEVDVKVELPNRSTDLFEAFVMRKVRRLLEFGAERVVWIFSRNKTVIVAFPDGHWDVQDWDKDIEILPGVLLNVAQLLKEEGINPDMNV